MATQKLVIDNDGQGRFLLRVDGNGVTVTGPDGERVLESLKVLRIHCVIDVETDGVTVRGDEDDGPQVLEPGDVLEGESRIRLQAPTGGQSGIIRAGGIRLKKRLLAVAGPDEGQGFPLPESGFIALGKDRAHVQIFLRGLRVDRVHCHVRVEGNSVEVVDEGKLGTFINGKRITRSELKPGDVLKIDNNQLRYEAIGPNEEFPPPSPRRTIQDEVAEEEAELEAMPEAPPANAPEGVKLLHEWRVNLPQLAGQEVGHYALDKVLGRGRHGVAFRASDGKTGQTVALKVFSPQFPANTDELKSFAAVMKELLPLRHDHVVTLLGVGKNQPFTWMALELVDGDSVARIIRRQERDEEYDAELACRVALHTARALVFARENRVRHGALTPGNIIVRKNDQVCKLTGLMLNQALDGSGLAQAVVDSRTPAEVAYLSPEQATPGAFVDELSDMYALGAVLYHMLTGRTPFVAKTTEEMLAQIRGPAHVDRPTKHNADVPRALEVVVMKLLMKQPENRYTTPEELLKDLEPIAASLGVED